MNYRFELDNIIEIFKDDIRKRRFLSNLTGEELKKYLICINSQIRGVSENNPEAGIITNDRVLVGSLVSPRSILHNSIFSIIADLLRNVDDRRVQATAMYYLINHMHLFADGNGRTSRYVYDLFTNPTRCLRNDFDYTHNSVTGEKKIFHVFEGDNFMLSSKEAGHYTSHFLRQYLLDLWPTLKLTSISNAYFIKTHTSFDFLINDYRHAFISDKCLSQHFGSSAKAFSPELKAINYALLDNNSSCSIGGLTLAIMLAYKGCSSDQIQSFALSASDFLNNSSKDVHFWIDNDDVAFVPNKYMSSWSLEDYSLAVYVADRLKLASFNILVDIFRNPNNYKVGSETVLDRLMLTHPPYPIAEIPCYENDIGKMQQSDFNIVSDSPAYITLNLLKNFMIENPSKTQSVKCLGSQVSDQLRSSNSQEIQGAICTHACLNGATPPVI